MHAWNRWALALPLVTAAWFAQAQTTGAPTSPSASSSALAAIPQVSVGRIERLADFPSRFVGARHIDVWLPADYSPAKRYQVLYMHDGQNLFDGRFAFGGKCWQPQAAVDRLV